MANLTIQKISLDGNAPTFAAADSTGDKFYNDGKTFFQVKNGGTASITVTVNSAKPCNYGFDHDISVTIAAGSEIQLGSFNETRFNNEGYVEITYSDVTSVTVAAVKI